MSCRRLYMMQIAVIQINKIFALITNIALSFFFQDKIYIFNFSFFINKKFRSG